MIENILAISFFTLQDATTVQVILFFVVIFVIGFFFTGGLRYLKKVITPINPETIAMIKTRCLHRGLNQSEIELFIDILRKEKVENYEIYFESFTKLKELILKYVLQSQMTIQSREKLIETKSKLYKILNHLAIPFKKRRLYSSVNLREGQKIKIAYKDKIYDSKILIVNNDYIVIDRVKINNNNESANYENLSIEVYFYYPGDAGYCFDTTIIRDITSKKLNALVLNHSDKLRRMQKRRYLRKDCSIPCYLNPIHTQENENGTSKNVLVNTSYNVNITNISINGCMVVFQEENALKALLPIKHAMIQFTMKDEMIKVAVKIISVTESNAHFQFIKFYTSNEYLINDFIYLTSNQI